MPALYVVLPILCIFAIAYRYYSAFLATRVLMLDDTRVTPAHRLRDGHNFVPTNRWVLFGHHFAAITGAGPLIGPVLAAQFGYAPGLIWLVAGVCLGGAVHDLVALWGSTRREGRSLAEITRAELGGVAGTTAAVAILFIIVIALAGLGLAVVNALADSAWGTFTIGMTIPLAVLLGFHMFRWRPGRLRESAVLGVGLMLACVVLGERVAASSIGPWFVLSRQELTVALAIYGFAASVLPVWMLLTPRDYLSTFMKLGTVGLLIIGVLIVNPLLQAPAFSPFLSGGGPIIPGPVFPFVFITIACGAISGFHALIATGTTPKMIERESDIRPIGYGAMLCEGLVGVMAIIAATALHPADYYAVNTSPAVFESMGLTPVRLPELERAIGETVAGRPGGAVSLAVGMAEVFTRLPGMSGLLAYWYHFAIMFEALFILTTIDAGTRVGRFLIQELGGRLYAPFARPDWLPGSLFATTLLVAAWAYFIWTGSISTIWPMFGIANQLLASVALAVGTTLILRAGRGRYVWVTLLPLCVVATTTLTAGVLSIRDIFWPMAVGAEPAVRLQGAINVVCTSVMITCVLVILAVAVRSWIRRPGALDRPTIVPDMDRRPGDAYQ